ncbi:unnamed protein product [Porites evermanni]|uniref:Uncharacterized protein n=1 Tax=Porites evermanni TaxID=104178 RepID=A0ABN8QH90_9CNID|nr:unnamed protein product [Porites evermanni]
MVQTTRNLLTKSDDPYEAPLAYRATPLENELCMGRRLRTTLPTTPSKLTPQWPELKKLREKEAKIKTEQTNSKTDDMHNATVRRNRGQLNPNPTEAKYAAGSPLPDPPETSKDQPPVLAERKDALRSAQKSSIPVPVPGTSFLFFVPEEKSTRPRD